MSRAHLNSFTTVAFQGAVVALFALAATGSTTAAQCHDGHPSFAMDSPPDWSVYSGSPPGTHVYGLIADVVVTLDSKARALDGDATLSCDDKRIMIRTHDDNATHVFPIEAEIRKIYVPGVSAVFAGLTAEPSMRRRIREGSAVLLKVL